MNFTPEQLTLNACHYHYNQCDEEALACIELALQQEPDYTFAYVMKAMITLSHGDYENGWPLLELLGHRDDATKYGMNRYPDRPLWDGKPTDKKVLVWSSMGHGDMIMLFRYIPMIAKLAPNFVLETHPLLTDLAKHNKLADRIISLGRHHEEFDLHWPLFSSPYLFKTTFETIPPAPYIDAEPFSTHEYPKIGLFCQSFSTYSEEALVRNLDDVSINRLGTAYKMLSLHKDGTFDFLDTARRVKSLDLVVTTDSAVAHLVGAMGAPTFLMLPVQCCWRWLQNRTDSPWYPSIRIFRQKTPRDWVPVIDEVLEAIEQFGKFDWQPAAVKEMTAVEAIRYTRSIETPRVARALGRADEWNRNVREKIPA